MHSPVPVNFQTTTWLMTPTPSCTFRGFKSYYSKFLNYQLQFTCTCTGTLTIHWNPCSPGQWGHHHWWTDAFGKLLMKSPWTVFLCTLSPSLTNFPDRFTSQTSNKCRRSLLNQVINLDFGREKPRPHILGHPPPCNNEVNWVEIWQATDFFLNQLLAKLKK